MKRLLLLILTICILFELTSIPTFAAENTAVVMGYVPTKAELIRNARTELDIPQEPSKAVYPRAKIEAKKKAEEAKKRIYMGKFRVTYYCACYSCSEGYGNMTATGVRAKEGRTIAVDPRVIPYRTKVQINGHTYVAEDCGGAIKGKDIDVYLEDHDRVYRSGVDYYDVYILRE